MRKNSKLVAVLSAAALMAMGASITSMAATGWVKDSGGWRFYTANDDYATDTFKKSGEYFFYLNDDGIMLTDQLVDHDGNYYYVDVNGAMAVNRWEKLNNEDGDTNWYYFGSNGKAKSDGWTTINGKRYHFTDSKMDSGWYQDDDNDYYLGTEDEGWAYTGWLEYDGMDDEVDKEEGWYWFDNNGKMVKDKEKKINGYYYAFNDEGLMLDQWVGYTTASTSVASASSYDKYYRDSNGNRVTGWVYLDDIDDDESDKITEAGWYYFKSGRPYTSEYKTTKVDDNIGFAKIKNKTYAFDENGKMYDGTLETSDGKIFYFGEEDDGAMKTGRVKIKNSDDYEDETMYFSKKGSLGEKGASVTGVESGYLYDNGLLVKADDNYEIVTVGGDNYLVKENGKVVTKGTVKDNDNDIKYTVEKNSDGGYTITSENID